MLSPVYLKTLTDSELVRIAGHEVNDLTSTPLEVELLARLEPLIGTDLRAVADEHDADPAYVGELLEATNEFEFEPAQLRELLESHPSSVSEMASLLALLNDQDIHTRDQLQQLITASDEFRALASDAGDVFERLSTLTTKALKE